MSAAAPAPTLLAVAGRSAGVRHVLERERIVIGRSSSSDIQLLDEAVSRQHVALELVGGLWHARDLGSQNGFSVNGVRVSGAARLVPGDAIGVGDTTFLFQPALDYLPAGGGAAVIIADQPPASTEEVDLSREGAGAEGAPAGAGRDAPTIVQLPEPEGAARPEIPGLLLGIVARAAASGGTKDAVGGALALVAEQFSAERAFLLRAAAEAGGRPKVVATFGAGPITVSRTVVDRVLGGRRAVVSGDAARDVAFQGGVSLLSAEIRSLLAAPLVFEKRTLGMVHLDRRARNAYGPADLAALVAIAPVLSLVTAAADGIEQLERRARRAHRIERPEVVAASDVMKALVADVARAARARTSVLLTGESGTGKEVLARLLHAESDRRAGPFVAVNCGALPTNLQESELFGHERGAFTGADREKVGLFEAAQGGTLFLDEVGECAPETQVKLLRALQERVIYRIGSTRPLEVDARIVAATSRRVEEQLSRGELREDLYYRLAVIHLVVPPLRDRPDDVAPLARAFLRELCRSAGVPPVELADDAIAALTRRDWPGNVRELRNAIERLVIMSPGPRIELGDLPADLVAGRDEARRAVRAGDTLQEAVARVEREMILRAIDRTGGVKAAIADALGISRVTLDKKLELYGLDVKRRRP